MNSESRDALLSLRGELEKQLVFIQGVIESDRVRLEAYRAEHGDLYYRPKIGNQGFGPPTDSQLVPVVT